MAYSKGTSQKSRSGRGLKQDLAVRLRRVQGQISGIEKMLESGRYCVDVIIQLRAVFAALKSIEAAVFENHLRTCVRDALKAKNESEVDQKIVEIMSLLGRKSVIDPARALGKGPNSKQDRSESDQEEACVH